MENSIINDAQSVNIITGYVADNNENWPCPS